MPSPPRDAEPATGHLHRPRLSQSLLRSPARIHLLWAPAGSGKSALLRECAQACPDDTRLCRFELYGQAPAIGPFLTRLAAALDLDGAEPEQVLAGLAQRQAPIWLMLDDLPRRADAEFDALLNQLLLHASPQVHWWLASRRRSGLQLERLLLAGELHELDGAQLALTASELEQLLRQEGWPEPERKAAELLEQTAGWCAGVRLRLLTAQAPERGEHMLRNYLEQELLEDLAPGHCQALSTLACLPGSAAELCEQLAGVERGRTASAGSTTWAPSSNRWATASASTRPSPIHWPGACPSPNGARSTATPAGTWPSRASCATPSGTRCGRNSRRPPPACSNACPWSGCCRGAAWPCCWTGASACRRNGWKARRAW
ncbi:MULTISPECIES: hypothetical protein [unclassified Pseudomonas]|uniref:hypothetical protein n=1 Tax=unclassified Pseudomonas TaxID=196821 RepID=UPI0024495971|nr:MULTISPECIES: hypothetical protein [unclassified Pseudomonas]MDH0893256.1 hypothetical protein [Pseudomonas sp. GD03875]MDH1064238.1 hypothetical protein [Pseudomonas sp. GD03985]